MKKIKDYPKNRYGCIENMFVYEYDRMMDSLDWKKIERLSPDQIKQLLLNSKMADEEATAMFRDEVLIDVLKGLILTDIKRADIIQAELDKISA